MLLQIMVRGSDRNLNNLYILLQLVKLFTLRYPRQPLTNSSYALIYTAQLITHLLKHVSNVVCVIHINSLARTPPLFTVAAVADKYFNSQNDFFFVR